MTESTLNGFPSDLLPGVSRVLVIGAGTMGRGIAQVAVEAGFQTAIFDSDQVNLARGRATIDSSWQKLVERGKRTPEQVQDYHERLSTIPGLSGASGFTVVIEAIFENVDAKSNLLKQLGDFTPPDVLIASNTSSISLTRLAARVAHPDRFVGLHFFNPAPVLPLVEVVRALQTSDDTAARAVAFAKVLGKSPVLVHDAPGFVANRILLPMINEAIFTLAEGVADKEAIDAVMKLGASHPMGPLALADLIGLDICLDIMRTLHRDFGDDKYRPAPLLQQLVDAGRLGRKSGEGFYRYDE